MKFGVSVYPEQESFDDTVAYLKLAAHHGFTKVFTSMFSVDETAGQIASRFKRLSAAAHDLGMEICADANPQLFDLLGATADDLTVFHEMGIDTLRMDMPFFDERNATLLSNPFGIAIEYNAMMKSLVDRFIGSAVNSDRMRVCHNFYPQRYTGVGERAYREINDYWAKLDVPVGVFVSSQNPGAFGPWPVRDGLPTLEDTRDLPIDLQMRYILLMGGVDKVIVGNEPATEEELAAINSLRQKLYPKNDGASKEEGGLLGKQNFMNARPGAKHTLLHIVIDSGISEAERQVAFSFRNHYDCGDGTEYMLRSRMPRLAFEGLSLPPRPCDSTVFHRGDVLIVNDSMARYKAELQIVLRDMRNDGQRNLIGRISPSELFLLDHIEPSTVFLLENV